MTITRATSSIAYLSDPVATGGTGPLFDQKARIDALASALGLPVIRYVVDSGRGDDPSGTSSNLAALLRASADMCGQTILVDGLVHFDRRPAVAQAIAKRFERDGLSVISTAAVGVTPPVTGGDLPIPSGSRSKSCEDARVKRRDRAVAP